MSATEFFIACLIGAVEGLTEFLPVSSTGHMILVGHLVDFHGPRAASFEVFIQLGAIMAVIFLYKNRFLDLFDFRSSNPLAGLRGLALLAVGCLPAFILGALLHRYIKEHLFSPMTVCWALIIGGTVMLFIEKFLKRDRFLSLEDLTLKRSLTIGLFQTFALWPGVSRSASTIIGGIVSGLSRSSAAEFSFLIAVPIMIAATGLDLIKSLPYLSSSDIPFFGTGFLVAFLSALIAIKGMVRFLQNNSLVGFGIYRIVLGVLYLFFLL